MKQDKPLVKKLDPSDITLIKSVLKEHSQSGPSPLSYSESKAVLEVLSALDENLSFAFVDKEGNILAIVVNTCIDFWYSDDKLLSPLILWVTPEKRNDRKFMRILLRLEHTIGKSLGLPVFIETIKNGRSRGRIYR